MKNQLQLHGKGFSGPKLASLDLQPYTTTQAPDRSDVLNVGGFSDPMFDVIAGFFAGDAARFVSKVEKIELTS